MARGQRRVLSKVELLNIELSAICSRNQYTREPELVIEELRRRSGPRIDILARVAGSWAGYYADDYTATLCAALVDIEGAGEWIALGRQRRGRPPHHTPRRAHLERRVVRMEILE